MSKRRQLKIWIDELDWDSVSMMIDNREETKLALKLAYDQGRKDANRTLYSGLNYVRLGMIEIEYALQQEEKDYDPTRSPRQTD